MKTLFSEAEIESWYDEEGNWVGSDKYEEMPFVKMVLNEIRHTKSENK